MKKFIIKIIEAQAKGGKKGSQTISANHRVIILLLLFLNKNLLNHNKKIGTIK